MSDYLILRVPVMMNFKLGKENIRPVNDGSIEISYLNKEKKAVSWYSKIPVLSIEIDPFSCLIDARQNDVFREIRRILNSCIAMPPKSFVKCLARPVTPNFTTIQVPNTKRYPQISRVLVDSFRLL